MEYTKSVFIADANNEFCVYLKNELQEQPDINVVGVSGDGLDTVRRIEALNPDVVLMDTVLPGMDGMGVLRRLNQDRTQKKSVIVVMSYFATELLEKNAAALGAQYFLVKPFEIDNLLTLLRYQIKSVRGTQTVEDAGLKIAGMLRDMGMPSHIRGFHYIREAIIQAMSIPNANYGITKVIYPQVAKKFSTTPSRVERAIRSAIEIAWSRGDINTQYDLFRNSVCGQRGKPTNSEFIATLTDDLLMQRHTLQPRDTLH